LIARSTSEARTIRCSASLANNSLFCASVAQVAGGLAVRDYALQRIGVYKMVPGDGVHIPVNAPHWVTNGESPSVSLSVNFEFKGSEKSDVYRTNYYLRQLGLTPTPPGESPLKDEVKRRLVLPAIKSAKDLKHSVAMKVKKLTGTPVADPGANGNTRRM